MISSCKDCLKFFMLLLSFLSWSVPESSARDYYVTGKVTDPNGTIIPDARVSMIAGTTEYAIRTRSDGTYSLRISNIYDNISGSFEVGIPFPNPFTYSVNIPFIINSQGDIRFSVYNISGQKIMEAFFDSIDAGSYHIVWDGCNQKGAPQHNGFYFYAITYEGKTFSGKLIKASGFSSYSAGTAIEPDMMAPAIMPVSGHLRFPVVTSVTNDNYYPNFMSEEPSYLTYSDSYGPNSYLGYLNALKSHYASIPLVIAEFGVPSSWGSAHQSYSNMDHGGYSEQQQGEKDMRLMHNIVDAGCAGGFMFAWMDEWFKPTWIVSYLEAYGMNSGGITIPTRQLWHNLASPEQNFGLLTFDETGTLPFVSYETDRPQGPLEKISATNDNSCFSLEIEADRTLTAGDTVMIAFDTYLSSFGESELPNGKHLNNRSEFLLTMVLSNDTALYHVTEAYDMNGLTPRFDLANHTVQKFYSTVSDGAPWKVMQWINDGITMKKQDIGKFPVENAAGFSFGQRTAAAWSGKKIKVRIPWTLLYFRDPTQMKVIDGEVSYDGGYNYEILTSKSDGIAVSVYFDGVVTSSISRYSWPLWLTVPSTEAKEKKSLEVIRTGLSSIPGFTD